MKLSRSLCRPRPEAAFAFAACLAAAVSSGCVTPGMHRSVVEERDQLRAQNHQLEQEMEALRRSNENLDQERIELVAQTEELLDRKEQLEGNLERLRSAEAALSAKLATTQERLAAQEAEVSRLRGTFEGLVQDLESEVAAGQIEIQQLREGIRLNVSDEILFAPGSADIGPQGAAVLSKVAGQLVDIEQRIEVQGHSDDRPISGALQRRFPSNWELAAARAASVVRLLQKQGVPGERLSAVSFAEYRPVASNDDAEGRALNRRIEIRLLPPEVGEAPEAGAGAS